VRIASLNLLHGESPEDAQVDLQRVCRAVKELDPDVLAIQEVDRAQARSHEANLTEVVADAMGACDSRFQPTMLGDVAVGWRPIELPTERALRDLAENPTVPDGPAYGVALLTRLPVRRWSSLLLAPARVRPPRFLPQLNRWVDGEPRAVLIAELETSFGVLTVAGAHLSYAPVYNVVQLRRTSTVLHEHHPRPQLLLGDLNLSGALPQVLGGRGWRPLVQALTFPAHQPRAQLDHVLARGPLPQVTSAQAVRLPFSDHRALVVDLA
jgi:endonuclease/exonuclease/phosphatase family metal-dependent hydrolase